MTAASADVPPYTNPKPPEVVPAEVVRDPATPSSDAQGSTSLPVTGADIAGLVLVGGTLTAGGLVMRGAARRRTPASV